MSVRQQSTFAPADGQNRWMGSAAMDQAGGIGVAYNVSSSTVFPSVRYTGRAAGSTAPLGVLDQGEADIIVGKHRNGPTANVEVYFDRNRQQIRDLDTKHDQPFES